MTMDESYLGESGIFTDYEGEITDAGFWTWEKSKDPVALFFTPTFKTDSPDKPTHEERYSLGTGWSSEDGGETVTNDRGGKKFHKRFSGYQSNWIDHAVPLLVAAGVAEEFSKRGPAQNAAVWVGTRWQMGEKIDSYPMWDKEAKAQVKDANGHVVMKESRNNVPVAFLGFVGDNANGNGKVDAAVDVSFVPEELVGKLAGVANESKSRDNFMDRVMLDVPEVSQVDGLVGKLAGKGVWETLKVGVNA